MVSAASIVTVISSTILRLIAYVFFRWIPGHQLVPAIYTTAIIYLTSFVYNIWAQATVNIATRNSNGPKKFEVKQSPQDSSASKKFVVKRSPQDITDEWSRLATKRRKYDGDANGQAQAEKTKSTAQLTINGHVYTLEQDYDGRFLKALGALLLGLPHPWSFCCTLITALSNVFLVLGVVDVVYRGKVFHSSHELAFSRVGYVSDTSAKILLREPDIGQLPLYISYRGGSGQQGVDDAWKSAGQVFLLSNETDYTHIQTISSLSPSTHYQYAVSNNQSGFFTTAAPIGLMAPGASRFTFLTSSCIKPRFPYNPLMHPLSIPGLKHLARWIPKLQASFMLFLGDFIYVDVPYRFGYDAETYRREYRQVYASPDWPAASKDLPWLHVIDDHEIANDWDKQWQDPYPAAIDPWDIYHSSPNPPAAVSPNASYFQFTQGPASFFMMDTRRHRDPAYPSNANSRTKTMLGQTQLASLIKFLKRDEPAGVQWKFVISSIPFTRNWRINSADTWANYLYERRIILEAMWDVGMRGDGIGVVVLSGDRHEFAATSFPPPKDSKWPLSATVHEFSTSPLSMFYLPTRSYWEKPGEDDVEEVCIKYAPDGNSKFGAVELEHVKGGEQGLLRFRLFVDGVESWDYVLMTPPAIGGGGRGKDAVWG